MKSIISIVALFITIYVSGQNTPKTLLWEVTKAGNTHKSYIFGTFHEIDPLFFNTLTVAVEKLKSADMVYVEEKNVQNVEKSTTVNALFTWQKAKWDSLLTKEQQTVFQDFVTKSERKELYKLPPLTLARVISGMYIADFCGENTSAARELMDTYIEKLAIKNGKMVQSLDENQVVLLNVAAESLSQNLSLKYTEMSIGLMQKMLKDDESDCNIIKKYKSFEFDYDLDTDLTQQNDYSPLLIERNKRWVTILNKNMDKHNCFVAVGLKHLSYKQGLIQSLRQLGYMVNPILLN